VAFDHDGNLWANVVWAKKLVKFSPDQIVTSGAPDPVVEIGELNGPGFVTFDAAGNLWTARADRVVRFDAARLSSSTNEPPDLILLAQTPPPVVGPLPPPKDLAFDAAGNAWVNYSGTITKLTPDDQSGSGDKTLTPGVQLRLSVVALPAGLVFDESGGLWFAHQAGWFARLSPAQLAMTPTSTVVPDVIIKSPVISHAFSFSFFPAPAALPLFHSY
jgi:streptogramin lyase